MAICEQMSLVQRSRTAGSLRVEASRGHTEVTQRSHRGVASYRTAGRLRVRVRAERSKPGRTRKQEQEQTGAAEQTLVSFTKQNELVTGKKGTQV